MITEEYFIVPEPLCDCVNCYSLFPFPVNMCYMIRAQDNIICFPLNVAIVLMTTGNLQSSTFTTRLKSHTNSSPKNDLTRRKNILKKA